MYFVAGVIGRYPTLDGLHGIVVKRCKCKPCRRLQQWNEVANMMCMTALGWFKLHLNNFANYGPIQHCGEHIQVGSKMNQAGTVCMLLVVTDVLCLDLLAPLLCYASTVACSSQES